MEILNLTASSFEKAIEAAGYPKFRSSQIIKWIYKKSVYCFEEMTDLSKDDRIFLAKLFSISPLPVPVVYESKDGTKKLTFTLEDDLVIESVIIPEDKRNTLCVSTQAGCPLKCSFCRTGMLGFKRNLSVREITGQVIRASQFLEQIGKHINNIVYMGMGEPLLNFNNTIDSIHILLDDKMLNFSNRKITVSTAGIPEKIIELGEKTKVNLAISLHAVNDNIRNKIMPVNQKYSLKDLFTAVKRCSLKNRKKIMLEYVLLKGVNDSLDDAKELAKIAHSLKAKVNLIPFNIFEGTVFEPTPINNIIKFQNVLISKNVTALLRKSRGDDNLAACGQLGK